MINFIIKGKNIEAIGTLLNVYYYNAGQMHLINLLFT